MYDDYDDEVFLGAEAMVSLSFEPAADEQHEEWAPGEAADEADGGGWSRHAPRASGFDASKAAVDEEELTLRDAIRHVLRLNWG